MLSGCAAIPATVYVTAGVALGGVAVTALHDCHLDHGCTYLPVPP